MSIVAVSVAMVATVMEGFAIKYSKWKLFELRPYGESLLDKTSLVQVQVFSTNNSFNIE